MKRLVEQFEQHWGVTADILNMTAPSVADDPRFRHWFTRYQRLSMPRGAATTMYSWVVNIDVRSVLPSIRVPTLVLHRADATHHRVAHGRYLAQQIKDAKLVELPGADTFPFHAGNYGVVLDEVQEFLTGVREAAVHDRILATVLFTDLVGSTRLAAQLGDQRWLDLKESHDRIMRDYIQRYRGREIDHSGDGFLATFVGPARAVTCAVEMRKALRSLGLQLRAGLHTGEVELRQGGIGGITVHIAARIMALAEHGGVFLSRTVKDLLLGCGIDFSLYGTQTLKGIPGSWELWQVDEAP
ncbi:MAG: adenylate/guanylate cyclase domain-containing protein [Saprospiraceae bacterium]|nr:adenylate/guanylate cyclase domain-containing protein [Saprospiraceae bacterium]